LRNSKDLGTQIDERCAGHDGIIGDQDTIDSFESLYNIARQPGGRNDVGRPLSICLCAYLPDDVTVLMLGYQDDVRRRYRAYDVDALLAKV